MKEYNLLEEYLLNLKWEEVQKNIQDATFDRKIPIFLPH